MSWCLDEYLYLQLKLQLDTYGQQHLIFHLPFISVIECNLIRMVSYNSSNLWNWRRFPSLRLSSHLHTGSPITYEGKSIIDSVFTLDIMVTWELTVLSDHMVSFDGYNIIWPSGLIRFSGLIEPSGIIGPSVLIEPTSSIRQNDFIGYHQT